jgi:hypothetical protein
MGYSTTLSITLFYESIFPQKQHEPKLSLMEVRFKLFTYALHLVYCL